MNFCSACLPGRMCDPCALSWVRAHAKNAKVIGEQWADHVLSVLINRDDPLPDWPDYDDSPKLQEQADAKMRHLAGSDPVVREAMARACADAARCRYEAVRKAT
jgi:hypothetical protein